MFHSALSSKEYFITDYDVPFFVEEYEFPQYLAESYDNFETYMGYPDKIIRVIAYNRDTEVNIIELGEIM